MVPVLLGRCNGCRHGNRKSTLTVVDHLLIGLALPFWNDRAFHETNLDKFGTLAKLPVSWPHDQQHLHAHTHTQTHTPLCLDVAWGSPKDSARNQLQSEQIKRWWLELKWQRQEMFLFNAAVMGFGNSNWMSHLELPLIAIEWRCFAVHIELSDHKKLLFFEIPKWVHLRLHQNLWDFMEGILYSGERMPKQMRIGSCGQKQPPIHGPWKGIFTGRTTRHVRYKLRVVRQNFCVDIQTLSQVKVVHGPYWT